MQAFKNLPSIAKIGIVAGLGVIVLLLVYMTLLKPPAPVTIISTQDYATYTTAQDLLRKAGIKFDDNAQDGVYSLTVSPKDQVEASNALGASGLKDRTGLFKKIKCPAAPGFTATRAANERADNCADAKSIQDMLLTMGAIGANVSVNQEENGNLVGPEMSKNVAVQIFLPDDMVSDFDATSTAYAIKAAIGAPLDHIFIGDTENRPLYNGAQAATKTGASAADATAAGIGCADMASATEIATKEAAVSACKKEDISKVLDEILGSSDLYALSVNTTINASAKSVTTSRTTPGPITSKSTQHGDGMNNEDTAIEPGNETVNSNTPAGGIAKLSISVALDKSKVSADQVLAVKQALSTFVSAARNDPAPTVIRTTLHKSATPKDVAQRIDNMKTNAKTNAAEQPAAKASSKLPMPVLILMIALVVGLVATIMVLLVRSSKAAAERERYAAEFANQQQVFNTFVQQDPGAMAADLESMFGAPSAQRGI